MSRVIQSPVFESAASIMIKASMQIPDKCYVACSGGPDSMAVLDFVALSKRDIGVLHVNHKTGISDASEALVRRYCDENNIPLSVCYLPGLDILKEKYGTSAEACWHEERNKYFQCVDRPVITGHNLNDACEWWLLSSFNGNGCLMPSTNGNIIRPFLLTKKDVLQSWCDRKQVPHIMDPSNRSYRYSRNRVRHKILPQVLKIQPGFFKVIYKKLLSRQAHELPAQPG